HHEIDDGDLERVAVHVRLPQRFQRVPGRYRQTVFHPPGEDVVTENGSRVRFIVDNQDPDAGQFGFQTESWILRATLQRNGEPECRTAVLDALDTDVAVHQLDDPLRDAQPQTGPAEPATDRTVGLDERLKEASLLRRRQSNPLIDDGEPHLRNVRVKRRELGPDDDGPMFGE